MGWVEKGSRGGGGGRSSLDGTCNQQLIYVNVVGMPSCTSCTHVHVPDLVQILATGYMQDNGDTVGAVSGFDSQYIVSTVLSLAQKTHNRHTSLGKSCKAATNIWNLCWRASRCNP